MSAKDLYHDAVRNALVKDGWEITHDPLRVKWRRSRTLQIDLGARKTLAAIKDGKKIAVEVKSFIIPADMDALYNAVGQFLIYRAALEEVEPDREIFLAIRAAAYEEHFMDELGEKFRAKHGIKLIVIDQTKEEILRWIP